MNIFVLDHDIQRCARYHCDQHVVKMILESAQMLCTTLNRQGIRTPYRSTHVKHPCVLWLAESYDNFLWLKELALALNREYRFRYQKEVDHASIAVIKEVAHHQYEARGLTEFAQAMPDQYKVPGQAVQAYRAFYIGAKLPFASWTRRPVPSWIRNAEKK